MNKDAYRDELRLKLTGGVLHLELDDSTLDRIIDAAFREIQRYIDTTRLATLPFKPCMDLSECGVSSVSRVFRTQGYMGVSTSFQDGSLVDPMQAAQWQLLSGGAAGWNVSDWALNYGAWNTMLQIRNTTSTDLLFRFDRHTNFLYINCSYNPPKYITIEYVPRYDDVSQIVSDYWIDMLLRMALALTKVTVGRVRSRFTQSNALWSQDGEKLLEEGNAELEALRTFLSENHNLCYPID